LTSSGGERYNMCASLTCSGGERGNISVSKKIIDSPKFKKNIIILNLGKYH